LRDDLDFHPVHREKALHIAQAGGVGLYADRRAVQLQHAAVSLVPPDHQPLAVEITGGHEIHAVSGIAAQGPGGVAGQQVDFVLRQGIEALLVVQRDVFDPLGIAQYGRRGGTADVDVHAAPAAVGLFLGKPRHVAIDPAT
jgi:hypothetical protein